MLSLIYSFILHDSRILFSQCIALKWLFSYVHSHHAETNTEFKIGFRRIFRFENYNLLIDVGEFGHRHIRRRLMPTRTRYFFEMPFAMQYLQSKAKLFSILDAWRRYFRRNYIIPYNFKEKTVASCY